MDLLNFPKDVQCTLYKSAIDTESILLTHNAVMDTFPPIPQYWQLLHWQLLMQQSKFQHGSQMALCKGVIAVI